MKRILDWKHKGLFKKLLIWAIAILTALDILTTWIGLRMGFGESTPTMRFFFDNLGFFWGCVIKVAVALLILLWFNFLTKLKNEFASMIAYLSFILFLFMLLHTVVRNIAILSHFS